MEESENLDDIIKKAKECLTSGDKKSAKTLFIKAVRIAERKRDQASGFEKFKYMMLINELNSSIKEIDHAEE